MFCENARTPICVYTKQRIIKHTVVFGVASIIGWMFTRIVGDTLLSVRTIPNTLAIGWGTRNAHFDNDTRHTRHAIQNYEIAYERSLIAIMSTNDRNHFWTARLGVSESWTHEHTTSNAFRLNSNAEHVHSTQSSLEPTNARHIIQRIPRNRVCVAAQFGQSSLN